MINPETAVDVQQAANQQAETQTQAQDTSLNPDWKSRIPAAHKDKGFWQNVKSEEDLYNQFAELQRYRGQSIKVPGDAATNEDWNSLYSKLGRPDDPGDYSVTLRDHDGAIQWDPQAEGWVKETAHKIGLNNKQTQQLIDSYGELILNSAASQAQMQNQQIEQLRDQFGDRYERNVTLGERALKKLGGDELLEYAEQRGWSKDPMMIKTMMKLGAVYEESNWIDGRVGTMSKADAQAKLSAIHGDMSHPYWSGSHPGHKDAVAEVMKLEDLIYG